MDSRLIDSADYHETAPTIAAQREQLFRASAVIEMCRYACASKFDGFDPEQLAVALRVVDDLVCGAAAALELAENETPMPGDGDAH